MTAPTTDTPAIETPVVPVPPVAPEVHASKLHSIFAELERVLGLAADPAVMALLPAKYQGYAAAAMLVEQVVASAAHPSAS